MATWPCTNQACNSYGKPHPNCKCAAPMATGGVAEPFCSGTFSHRNDCEYFAEGGEVDGTDEEPPGPEIGETDGTDEEPPGSEPEYDGGGTDEEPPGPDGPLDSTYDKVAAAYQGGLRGLVGPLADMVIKENPLLFGAPSTAHAREEANPGIAGTAQAATMIGGLLTGTGQAGAIAKASEVASGSKIIQSAIQGGLFQASDEVSKWALGEGDPQDAAGAATAIGASALFSGFLGGVGVGLSKAGSSGLQKLADAKMGERALNFLRGLGFAAKSQDPVLRSMDAEMAAKAGYAMPRAYNAGAKFFDSYFLPSSTATIGAMEGYHRDGMEGALAGALAGATVGFAGRKIGSLAGRKIIAPAAFKILGSGNVEGFAEAMDHAARMAQGAKIINSTVDGIFKMAPAAVQRSAESYGGDKLKRDLDDFLGRGGMNQSVKEQVYQDNGTDGTDEEPPAFAEGGEVKQPKAAKVSVPSALSQDNGVAMHYPTHNTLLSSARGRVSNYLIGLRPGTTQSRLPFDDAPDTRKQKKSYDRALHVAVNPMSVMKEIQKGTIEPEHIKHLNAMYPELTTLIQKKVTEKVVQSQLDGKKPPRHVRQGLSMLLGAALSTEFTPAGIQAAQSVFSRGVGQPPTTPEPQGQSSAGGGNKSKLSKSDQAFLTGPQAREKRAQRPS